MSSGAGLGLIPVAPGTFGTLAGIPVYLGLSLLPLPGYLAILVLFTLAAMFLAGRAEKIYGRKDDGRIVIDEVVGFAVTMIGTAPGLITIILGFLLFRFFDVLKPWPCRNLDRNMHGGAGVVMDDVAAGIYGALVLQCLIYFWPGLGGTVW